MFKEVKSYLFLSLAFISLNSVALTASPDVDDLLASQLGRHNRKCKTFPKKQVWYKFGKYRSACAEFDFSRISKLLKNFVSVEFVPPYAYSLEEPKSEYGIWRISVYKSGNYGVFLSRRIWHVWDLYQFCKSLNLETCKNKKFINYVKKKHKKEQEEEKILKYYRDKIESQK